MLVFLNLQRKFNRSAFCFNIFKLMLLGNINLTLLVLRLRVLLGLFRIPVLHNT